MSVAERHLDSPYASDELEFVLEQVRAGNYTDALQALARAKAEDPRNIFLIALEKQVTRLRAGGVLPREKTEIVDSLPGLVERARADHRSRSASPEPAQPSVAPGAPAAEKKDPRLKLVVEQYFRHADDWVKRRDFEAALKEIERVLLIDPENRVAKEYQYRVQSLFRKEQRELPDEGSAPELEISAVGEEAVARVEETKKVGKLVVFLAIGITAIVMVVGGIMFLRPSKGQYRVGYMYVSQSQLPAGEVQTATSAVTAGDVAADEGSAVENAPEVKPPAEPRAKAAVKPESKPETKTESAPAVKEQDVVESEPPKAAPSKGADVPSVPSAIGEKQKAPEESAGPARFIPVEQPPKIVQLQQPSFSDEQILNGVQGDIVVKVQIDKSGKPLQAKVISSTNPALDAAVIDAVMRSSYSPGVMSSGPVTTWMTIPLKLK